jgi:hypothetical protein
VHILELAMVNTEYSIADFDRTRLQLGPGIQIRIEEGKKWQQQKCSMF